MKVVEVVLVVVVCPLLEITRLGRNEQVDTCIRGSPQGSEAQERMYGVPHVATTSLTKRLGDRKDKLKLRGHRPTSLCV